MTDTQSTDTLQTGKLLEHSLLDIGIPPCPDILHRIMDEMRNEDPDYNRLADIISADVALSAGLIKTANAPFFVRPQRVRSAHEALTVLGLKVASNTIIGIALRKAFPDTPELIRFWDASARTARLCAWLAHKLDIPKLTADDAYTLGLLHDCGIPVLMVRVPDYKNVLGMANVNVETEFTSLEESLIQTNHALVGNALAQNWWLPEEMCLAIRHHHELSALTADSVLPDISRNLIAIVQFAEHIAQQQLGKAMTQEWPKLGMACLQILKVDEEDLDFLYAEARKVIAPQD